jgi:hypothetical protein
MAEKGCGYSLRLRTERPEKAVVLLRQEELPIGKVYWQRENAALEELVL